MKMRYILILLLTAIIASVNAQGLLKGTVYESATGNKLPDVFIRNSNNKQLGISQKDGSFSIKAETGNLIIFDSPGYVSDTLYVVDLLPKKIQLITQTIALREV